jgi:hypothetical protein
MTTSTTATTSSATLTLHLGYVYSNTTATTPVHSVHVITCIHNTSVLTAGGKRGENRKALEEDAVIALCVGLGESETHLMTKRRR